jgi:hypothetical protein
MALLEIYCLDADLPLVEEHEAEAYHWGLLDV